MCAQSHATRRSPLPLGHEVQELCLLAVLPKVPLPPHDTAVLVRLLRRLFQVRGRGSRGDHGRSAVRRRPQRAQRTPRRTHASARCQPRAPSGVAGGASSLAARVQVQHVCGDEAGGNEGLHQRVRCSSRAGVRVRVCVSRRPVSPATSASGDDGGAGAALCGLGAGAHLARLRLGPVLGGAHVYKRM